MTGSEPCPAVGRRPAWRCPGFGTALVAALFTVTVGAILLVRYFDRASLAPLEAPALTAARQQLHLAPTDEALKTRIRAEDLALRQGYLRGLRLNTTGAWLLAVGAAVCLAAAARCRASRTLTPSPRLAHPETGVMLRERTQLRWTIATVGIVAAATLGWIGWRPASPVPDSLTQLEARFAAASGPLPSTAGPSVADLRNNWPRFRGPGGDGVAFCTNAPIAWNATNGQGITWKAPVPVPGHSSPIVWGTRVFLTGGTPEHRDVVCFDAGSGALLWQKPVPPPPPGTPPLEIQEHTGYAASTPATDGERVFAIFGTGELAAFDFAGRPVWNKFLGSPENMYGHASSLAVWQNRLIVQYDQGDGTSGKSKVIAFDGATGSVVWEQRRAMPSSWTTPIVIEASGRPQLITCGEPWVVAYDPGQGTELWKADCLGTDLAPSPVYASGLVVASSPAKHVIALRPDGQGDVSKTHVAWKFDESVPDIASPVSDGERLYVLLTDGTLICLGMANGAKLWSHSLDLEFNVSPTLAGDRLYLLSTDGTGLVVATGPAYRELSRGYLAEPIHASPAIVQDRLFIRGITNLYCIGPTTQPAPPSPGP